MIDGACFQEDSNTMYTVYLSSQHLKNSVAVSQVEEMPATSSHPFLPMILHQEQCVGLPHSMWTKEAVLLGWSRYFHCPTSSGVDVLALLSAPRCAEVLTVNSSRVVFVRSLRTLAGWSKCFAAYLVHFPSLASDPPLGTVGGHVHCDRVRREIAVGEHRFRKKWFPPS